MIIFASVFLVLCFIFKFAFAALPLAGSVMLLGILLFIALFASWSRKQPFILAVLLVAVGGLWWYFSARLTPGENMWQHVAQNAQKIKQGLEGMSARSRRSARSRQVPVTPPKITDEEFLRVVRDCKEVPAQEMLARWQKLAFSL